MLPIRLLLFLCAASIPSLLSAQSTSPCNWNPDYDGDNTIGVNDLLALLGVFEEVDSDADGIFDSQDDCVGFYDPCGVCNGTGVDADEDGICDDTDPCVGALDACGLCNGPGPTFPIIDEIIYVTDSVFLPPVGTWYVFSYAVDTLYTFVCPVQGCTDTSATNFNPSAVIEDGSCMYGPAQCGGQSTVTFDGYTYALVGIGTQCWFKENLRSDNYRNGDPIPGGLSDSQWINATTGARTVYGEGSTFVNEGSGDEVANLAVYGRLYNWYAVDDIRGLCPDDFRVPSIEDWTLFENMFGGISLAGGAMKTTSWGGTNLSGFTALPGGARGASFGHFHNQGYYGTFWTASPNGTGAWYRNLFYAVNSIDNDDYGFSPRLGLSVRCIKE
jgi:uncharacterized protein (TIGR02145 family)